MVAFSIGVLTVSLITMVADGNLYQTTPNSRINIHKYRAGISLDQNGISSIIKVLNSNDTVTLSSITNFVHVYTTDTLSAVISSIDPTNKAPETHTIYIPALFMVTSAYESIVLTNINTYQVSVRIFYS